MPHNLHLPHASSYEEDPQWKRLKALKGWMVLAIFLVLVAALSSEAGQLLFSAVATPAVLPH